jgi:putative ABC transport system permease protein
MSSSRDLRWRWRRFLIAVAGTGLALALTLLLSGFREGIDLETTTSLRNLGADGFVVREGATGPFSTSVLIDASLAARVARLEGVSRADPVVTVRSSIGPGAVQDVYLVGAEPGGLGAPQATEGRAVQRSGEAVVDVRAKRKVGQRFDLGGKTFDVVGRVRGASVWVGVPNVYITLDDAQAVVFGGRAAATTILTRGVPREELTGTHVLTAAQARDDLERPLANAIDSIDVLRVMLWVVAAAIMGSVLYISAIERNREFAVCKAFGAAGGDVAAALGIQSLILTTLAAALAVAMARPLARLFPTVISLPARTVLLLFAVAVIVGLIGSLAGARRALTVDPAAAFSGP